MGMTEHNIIPKVAYVKCDADVDDFLANWQEDEDPTQEDYDEWAIEQMWAVLCSGGLYEDDIELMGALEKPSQGHWTFRV